ncbi:6704_t:CDS:2, partial [Entrophospora sp. SA101]
SSDYVVFNKEDHAKEALIAADHHQNSKLVVYSLECIITVSSYLIADGDENEGETLEKFKSANKHSEFLLVV